LAEFLPTAYRRPIILPVGYQPGLVFSHFIDKDQRINFLSNFDYYYPRIYRTCCPTTTKKTTTEMAVAYVNDKVSSEFQ